MGVRTDVQELKTDHLPPLYLVLHMHKTAGTTLFTNFSLNFKASEWLPLNVPNIYGKNDKSIGSLANPGWIRERIEEYVLQKATTETRCTFGHMVYYGAHKLFTPSRTPRYITFLREPVDRAISQYYYLRNQSTTNWHDEIVNPGWSIDEWFENTRALWVRDGQVRLLLLGTDGDVSARRELTRAHLEEAKRRLSKFWFVGLTEYFAADSYYLYGKFRFYRFTPEARLKITANKGVVSEETRRKIAEANQLDTELYHFAHQLRARFVHQNRFQYKWLILRAWVRKYRNTYMLPR